MLPKLKLFCEKFLMTQVDINNVIGMRRSARLYRSRSLFLKADRFVAVNFSQCASTEEFRSLEKGDLVDLNARSDLNCQSEELVFDAVTAWVNEQYEERCQYIFELLQQVRLALVEPSYLLNVVAEFRDCESSLECEKLIQTARRSV